MNINSVKQLVQVAKKESVPIEVRKSKNYKNFLKAANNAFKEGYKLEAQEATVYGHRVDLANKKGALTFVNSNEGFPIKKVKAYGDSIIKAAQRLFLKSSNRPVIQNGAEFKLPNLKG